jgi:hypothetical protein
VHVSIHRHKSTSKYFDQHSKERERTDRNKIKVGEQRTLLCEKTLFRDKDQMSREQNLTKKLKE